MAVPRAWWHAAAAAVLCVLLVAGQMPHLIQAPDAHMWGAASADGLGLIWTLWHASEHVMRLGSPGFQSQLAGFPEGGAFWPANPVEAFLLAPVTAGIGAATTYNLLQLLHVGLAAFFGALLGHRVHGRPAAAWLVGVGFGLGPVLLCSAHNGNVEVTQLYWLPAAALAALGSQGRPPLRALGTGALVGVSLVAHVYVGLMAGIAALLILAAGPTPPRERIARVVALAIGTVLVAGGPLALAWQLTTAEDALVTKSADAIARMRLLEGQLPALRLFTPWPRIAPDASGAPGPFLNATSPGVVTLVLGALGARRLARTGGEIWVGIALAGLLLALGPTLVLWAGPVAVAGRQVPLPYALLDRAPPFSMLIELWRFGALLQLGLLVLAAGALGPGRLAVQGGAVAAIALEALVLNPGPRAYETTALPQDAIRAVFEHRTAEGAVVVYPLGRELWPLYHQTIHGQPVGVSPDRRSEPELAVTDTDGVLTLGAFRTAARAKGYRWLLIDAPNPIGAGSVLGALLDRLDTSGALVARQGRFALIDLDHLGPWPDLQLEGQKDKR